MITIVAILYAPLLARFSPCVYQVRAAAGERRRERDRRAWLPLWQKRGQRARRGALRGPFDAIRSPAPQTPFEGHLVGMCEMRALEGARGPLGGAAKGARICLRGRQTEGKPGKCAPPRALRRGGAS